MNIPSNYREIVEDILLKDEKARNDDNYLCWYVWAMTFPKIKHDIDYLKQLFIEGELPKMESITRVRRKLQEENPSLRGSKYKERHSNQENYKKDLGYNVKTTLF